MTKGHAMEVGDIIAERRIDNPHITWAQFLHELEVGKPYAGVIKAPVNLTTLMGGFARFRGTEAQQKAAARFRSLYERSQLGGSKAIDPAIEAVDGGSNNPEAIFEIGADARKQWIMLTAALGKVDTRRFHFVVISDRGPTAYARWRNGVHKANERQISSGQVEIRRIADRLAVDMGFQSA